MTPKTIVLSINFLLIVWFLFYQNKNYRASVKWLLLFLLFPIVSFLIYYFIGMGIKVDKKRYKTIEKRVDQAILPFTASSTYKCNHAEILRVLDIGEKMEASPLTHFNDVRYYNEGEAYYSALMKAIEKAESSVHIEIYILRSDDFGTRLMDLLLKKAEEGVRVKILFDPNGNLFNKKNWLKPYSHRRLKIVRQYAGLHRIRNFNYRNHRKIVVIDGKKAFIGGFNFGSEYLSQEEKTSPFRDTQTEIVGESVLYLQRRFLIDFYYAYSFRHPVVDFDVEKADFETEKCEKQLAIQVISTSYFVRENIKRMKLSFLSAARKEVYIQTPYLILDPLMMEEMKLLLLAKVELNLMIPLKYDKRIPYCATLSCARELYELGAKVYLYEGFIHSKTMIVDDYLFSVGSSNFDIRSCSLNLETDAILYSYNEAERYKNVFRTDILSSVEYSPFIEEKMFSSFRLGKRVYRLISALM